MADHFREGHVRFEGSDQNRIEFLIDALADFNLISHFQPGRNNVFGPVGGEFRCGGQGVNQIFSLVGVLVSYERGTLRLGWRTTQNVDRNASQELDVVG